MSLKKYSLIFVAVISFCHSLYGQDVNEFFFDEADISFNRTDLKDENTGNINGFGVGLYHSFFAENRANLKFGIEYNLTKQFKKSMYEGHYAEATDLTYSLNTASFPLGLRFNMGKKVRVFLEAGGYADLTIKSKRIGTMHTSFPDANDQIVYKTYHLDEKTDLSSIMGLYSGIGIRIPVSGFEVVIKSDYKYGLGKLYSYMENIYSRYWRISVGIKLK